MEGIIPRHETGVDICGSSSHYYIIRSDLGCYMRAKDFNKGSDISIRALHPAYQNRDHYLAHKTRKWKFYIIKGDEYRTVTDLSEDDRSAVYPLPPNYRDGDHYLSAFGWFYIIFQKKGICRRTKHLSNDSRFVDFTLHPNWRDGLYFWGDKDHFYFLKPEWGVEYYKGKDFNKVVTFDKGTAKCTAKGTAKGTAKYITKCTAKCTAVYSIHPDVLNFLPGGLSITNGPAFSKWVKIETVINDSPTPVTWQKKVTKKVGYSKEKMSQITHNWRIAASVKISAGKLAGLIANAQFTLSRLYERSSVKTETEIWKEETEVEEELSRELKPHERLYVWQFQLGLGSEPVLFCRDLKITDKPEPPTEVPLPRVNSPVPQGFSTKTDREEAVPDLIMEPADTLCASLFRWLENREKCAGLLEKLAQELEDVPQGSNIAQGVGTTSVHPVFVNAAFISLMKGLASDSTAEKEGVSTFNKAAEFIKEDEKIGTSIQIQLRDLKDRCGVAPLGAHADELDCEVTTQLMSALARSHMTPGGLAAAEASDFICQALILDRFPEITRGLKVSATEMMKNIELIGIKAAEAGSEGVIGFGIFQCDPLEKSKEIANRSGITEASKSLRDSAREILDGQKKLKEQLDAMHEIIQKLFITKSLVEDLGEYSLSMTEKGQRIINYIKGTCTDDTVLSWLQGLTHQIEFVNLVRFFLDSSSPIPEYLTKPGGHIDIVIVSHGGIVYQFMPAGVLVPAPYIRDTILYSPWNCRIDAKTAFAIAQGTIQEADRAFFNIAGCHPIPLPNHWNHMQESHQARHNIPEILLSPLTPEEGAWRLFLQLWQNRRLEINNRVIIPYLVPQHQENAFGQIPLHMVIFSITSFLLRPYNKTATVHLAACLSRVQWQTQYAYTSDGMSMTVRIDEQDMNNDLFRAFSSLFDTTKHRAGERPGAV